MKSNAGFSLVEVMCAILILGIALTALIQGVNTALISSKESELQAGASLLAAGQIEALRADSLSIEDGVTEGDGGDLTAFQWRQTISGTQIPGLHDVKVVVESAHTGKQIFALETMLFDPPPTEETKQDKKEKDKKRKAGSL